MDLGLFGFIIIGVFLIMFITIFVVVLKIWNLQKEILESGGYSTVYFSRAKRDAKALIENRAPWDYEKNEIIRILSQYPDDPEASALVTRLKERKGTTGNNDSTNQDADGASPA